ncbi:phage head-tail connector protein [Clostridium saudiense]|jgi:hypothetical protein|uniref:phage head-tail connector protein n=1 Tax=Clostridium saudiense TaxID=1414720 RepID=UPI0018AC39AE|nr:phage head-tail connector protein [Clostridium saudiense]
MQIDKLKVRLNEEDTALLEQLLEDAETEILDYCNRDVLLPRMFGLQRELAIVYYNRLGSEGESSRSEGGVSVSYSTDIPENIKKRLNSYRRLKAVRLANENKE